MRAFIGVGECWCWHNGITGRGTGMEVGGIVVATGSRSVWVEIGAVELKRGWLVKNWCGRGHDTPR